MDKITLITTLTKAAIAIIMVLAGVYLLVNQIDIPEQAWRIALVVFSAVFGVDALVKGIRTMRDKDI